MVALGVWVASVLAFVLYQNGPHAAWLPGCLFHHLTGFACPGCGMTRATHAALHGHLGEAFRFNPLGMVLFPAALLGGGLELTGWMRGKALPVRLLISGSGAWWLIGVVLAFWVMRNLPLWPFSLLALP